MLYTQTWSVEINLFEGEEETSARATLISGTERPGGGRSTAVAGPTGVLATCR